MARQPILLGTSPTGAGGDTARQAFNKVNEMTDELYQSVGGLEEGATATGERLDALETFRGTAEPAISDLQTNLGTAETAISALQASREFNLTPGANITIDRTDPENPVISATGGGGGEGTVTSVAGVGPDGTGNVSSAELIPALGIDQKVNVEAGKGLSTNDFTDAEQTKLAGIEVGAQVNVGTDLSQGVRTDTTVTVGSSTGDGAVLDAASPTEAGVMSAADKAKLNGVAAGATANANTDELTEGSANLYFNEARVRATTLAGLDTGTAEAIDSADTVLSAIGKLQAQIDEGGGTTGGGELGATEIFTGNRATLATARPGRIPIDGGLLSRTTYADFWAFVQANYTVVSDADWLNASLGLYGHFSSGDGSTTFRMPDWNGAVGGHKRRVPRGTPGDGSGLTEDAFQGHWHGDGSSTSLVANSQAGSVVLITASGALTIETPVSNADKQAMVTDGSNGTPRVANETRAASIDGIWLMRAASGGSNPGTVDITALASEQVAQGSRITTLEAQKLTSGTAQASTSGTAIDFTGLPAGIKRLTVSLAGVSTNGASIVQFQLGTSAGVETSGYLGAISGFAGGALGSGNPTTGVPSDIAGNAAYTRHGEIVFTRLSGNTWVYRLSLGNSEAARTNFAPGSKTLAGELSRFRMTTVNGTDLFDAGLINVMWEA